MESTLSGAAKAAPAATIALSGLMPKLSKRNDSTPGSSKGLENASGMAGFADAGIGNDERAAEPQVAGELSGACDGCGAEHDARSRMKFERNHLK